MIKNKDKEEKTEFKLNPDFLKQVNDVKNSTLEEKTEFTSKKIDNLKEESKNIGEKYRKKFGISFEEVRDSDDYQLKSKWLDEYNNQKDNRDKKELLQKTVKNQVRLTVINNQAQNISIF